MSNNQKILHWKTLNSYYTKDIIDLSLNNKVDKSSFSSFVSSLGDVNNNSLVNKILNIKVNNVDLKITNKSVNIDLSNYVTNDNLSSFNSLLDNKLDKSSFSSFLSTNSLNLDSKLDKSSFSSFISTNSLVYKSDLDNYYTKLLTDLLLDLVTTGVVTNIIHSISGRNVSIQWTDPSDNNWSKTVLIRKIGSYPTSLNDGTVILNSSIKNQYSQSPYVDTLPSDANFVDQYYYRLFAVSVDNVANKSVNDSFYHIREQLTIGTATNVSYSVDRLTVNIGWSDPTDNNWKNTILVRKLGSSPISTSDGTIIVTETIKNSYSSNSYVDTLPSNSENGQVYYYKLFTVSTDDVINGDTDSFYITRTFVTTNTISNLIYVDNTSSVNIQWSDPSDDNWYSTTLIRKLGSNPSSISDGTVILTETTKNSYNSTPYIDTLPSDASSSNIYYYRLFTTSIDNVVNAIDISFYVNGESTFTEFRTQLKNGTINSSNIGDTFIIYHDTYGYILMQMVAYDDALLANGESATHTMTLLSKNCICKKQFDSGLKEYAITEDTVYRPDAIIQFNTTYDFTIDKTINYLIDDISKTGILRSWTSFGGQYVIKYNPNNNRWERGILTKADTYTINYYLNNTEITGENWKDSSNNSSSYFVKYIKKYYSYDGNNYTLKFVLLGNNVDSNTYEQNISCYADSSKARITYGYNRYSESGIRQWLNGSGYDWYTPLNIFCNPPSYVNEIGFMDGLPNDFKNALATVKIKTNLNYVVSQGYGGYKYDITEDKIFLPSYSEMSNTNNYSNKPLGNYWSYFNSNLKRIKTYNNLNTYWWLRSADSSNDSFVKSVNPSGGNYTGTNVNATYGIAFACVIKSI